MLKENCGKRSFIRFNVMRELLTLLPRLMENSEFGYKNFSSVYRDYNLQTSVY